MAKVAISYRRLDSTAITGRIFDRLLSRYGKDSVFMDIDNIPPGADFRSHITQVLHRCDVLLAIVGHRWLDVRKKGHTTIRDETDWIRIEVEAALRENIPVIPVLVEGARMPKSTQLPPSLQEFSFRHAATVDSAQDFHTHVDRLIRSIDRIAETKSKLPEGDAVAEAATAPTLVIDQPTDEPELSSQPSAQIEEKDASAGRGLSRSARWWLAGGVALFVAVSAVLITQYFWPKPPAISGFARHALSDAKRPAAQPRKVNPQKPLIAEEATLSAKTIVYKKGRATWTSAFDDLKAALKVVDDYVDSQALGRAGWPITIYTATDDTGFEFQAAIPLTKEPGTKLPDDLAIGKSPEGRALKFIHFGPYDNMDTIYEAITNYLDQRKLQARDLFMEQYVTDPLQTPEDQLVIEVYVPVK
jgi:effector-binding domain-containing protein